MPEQSRKIRGEYTYRISKVIEAPSKYAYDWLTDFRPDDRRFSSRKPRYRIFTEGPHRIVRIRSLKNGAKTPLLAVELIRLMPPNAWHVDQIDEQDLEAVDYEVRRLGPRRSRITLTVTERWMTTGYPSRRDAQAGGSRFWDKIVAALEESYRSGRPAKG